MYSAVTLAVTVLGQVVAEEAESTVQIQSVWDFGVKGGPMMIPIGLCSLIALTVTIERLFSLRRATVIPPGFRDRIVAALGEDAADKANALAVCKQDGSALARVFAAGIRQFGRSVELLEKHIEEAGQRAVRTLRKYLRILSVIAAIAPLLGLLGTIFGMINAFQTVAGSAEALGKTELLAEGIYQAMITTAAGLIVAIPTLVVYHWLSAKIDGLVAEIDDMASQFIEQYADQAPMKAPRIGVAQSGGGNGQSVEAPLESDAGRTLRLVESRGTAGGDPATIVREGE